MLHFEEVNRISGVFNFRDGFITTRVLLCKFDPLHAIGILETKKNRQACKNPLGMNQVQGRLINNSPSEALSKNVPVKFLLHSKKKLPTMALHFSWKYFSKSRTKWQVFSRKFCAFFESTHSIKQLWTNASVA